MDLNRLTRDADDLIRKVVSRYNQLYIPAGSISQVELDLMLDDLRKLYDTFKTIGQVNLSLQRDQQKPEVTVQTQAPDRIQNKDSSPGSRSFSPTETQNEMLAEPRHEPETKAVEASQPTAMTRNEIESEPQPHQAEPEKNPDQDKPLEERIEQNTNNLRESDLTSSFDGEQTVEADITETQTTVETVAQNPVTEINPENEPSMLADKFNSLNKSLSDSIASTPAKDVVGGRILYQPIPDLNTGIGLNDKFNFISELFGNNQVHYDEAISRINKAVNMDEANWILQKYHTPEWEHKHEAIKRMKDFIRRRFI